MPRCVSLHGSLPRPVCLNLTEHLPFPLLPTGVSKSAVPRVSPDKIKHMVVLLMENRPIDHTFGCMAGEGIIDLDGIPPEGWKIKASLDPSNDTTVAVTCGTANYVCEHGPPMDMWSLQLDPKSNHSFYPYGTMDDKFSYANGGKDNAIMMFNSTQLPIKTAVAENFAVFNNLHGSVPSFSTPNHLFTHTGTSCGLDDNLNYLQCGGNTATFPQTTIYDSLYLNEVSFSMYLLRKTISMSSNQVNQFAPVLGYICNTCIPRNRYTNSTTGACPEMELDGVARHKDRCFSHDQL